MKALLSALFAAALTVAGIGTATATVMQYTASATLADGVDGLGLFGPASGSLAGKSVALTIAFDTDLNTIYNDAVTSYGNAPATIHVVIGGVGYTTTITPTSSPYSYAGVMNTHGDGADYEWGVDQFGAAFGGTGADGLTLSGQMTVQSADPDFITASTTVTNVAGTTSPNYLSFGFDATGPSGTTHVQFDGYPGVFGVSQAAPAKAAGADVPEPASLALVAIGMLGLGWRRTASRG